MSLFDPDKLKIASPCSQRWENMKGDERVRYCASCGKNVYNVHGMTAEDAEALVRRSEFCAVLFCRTDKKVMTSDCPKPAYQMPHMLGRVVIEDEAPSLRGSRRRVPKTAEERLKELAAEDAAAEDEPSE